VGSSSYLPRIVLLPFTMRISGEQTVLDAREIASPMVVTWFAQSRCPDGLVWVGVPEGGLWLDRSPIGGLLAMAL
jgi:hypothetical protein